MPKRPPRSCSIPGCKSIAASSSSRCQTHSKVKSNYEKTRENSNARGYGYQWRKARVAYLNANPLCVHCYARGVVKSSTTVDHKQPHKGDANLFWDEDNWQALCGPCHSIKTALEDGGFGRPIKANVPGGTGGTPGTGA